MTSKTKQGRRVTALSAKGWFPLTEDMFRKPGEIRRKVKLVADANLPIRLVESLKKRKIDVRTAQALGIARLADEDLLRHVARDGSMLITMDRDFWSEGKFPLHQSGGLVFIDARDDSFSRTTGFELLVLFLVMIGGGWREVKFRATSDSLFLKTFADSTKKVVYEIKAIMPLVYAREIQVLSG